MSEKQSKIKGALEVFAKSIVQPLMYLSVAGILLIVGIVLTNSTVTAALPVLQSGPFQLIGKIIYDSLMFLINNLSIIFCVGIAGAMAKKNKGHAALIALMAYFLFLEANNITLSLNGQLVDAGESMLGLTGTGYFDRVAYEKFHEGKMTDYIPTDADLQKGFDGIPVSPAMKFDGAAPSPRRTGGGGEA